MLATIPEHLDICQGSYSFFFHFKRLFAAFISNVQLLLFAIVYVYTSYIRFVDFCPLGMLARLPPQAVYQQQYTRNGNKDGYKL